MTLLQLKVINAISLFSDDLSNSPCFLLIFINVLVFMKEGIHISVLFISANIFV